MNSRDFVAVNGKIVLHSTATRDYLCGECGGALVTICDGGNWRTVCAGNRSHGADGFVTKMQWAREQYRRLQGADEARQVLEHLPDEVRAAIMAE